MRTVVCKKVWRWTLKLRCRRCGRKETFYINGKRDVPSHGMNGWTLKDRDGNDTEMCALCMTKPRDGNTVGNLPRCVSVNPKTKSRCSMAQGHAGPHVVGNPYHPVERWVTKCTDEPCVYHEHFAGDKAGTEECIHCGDVRRTK